MKLFKNYNQLIFPLSVLFSILMLLCIGIITFTEPSEYNYIWVLIYVISIGPLPFLNLVRMGLEKKKSSEEIEQIRLDSAKMSKILAISGFVLIITFIIAMAFIAFFDFTNAMLFAANLSIIGTFLIMNADNAPTQDYREKAEISK